jgi:hypothetical protein
MEEAMPRDLRAFLLALLFLAASGTIMFAVSKVAEQIVRFFT